MSLWFAQPDADLPTIKRFLTFKITMYAEDHNPPHVHVIGKEFEATIAVSDCSVLAGGAPLKVLKAARAYIESERAELLAFWTKLNPGA
jgi:hypothetical protein